MKIKSTPDDFRVDEIASISTAPQGDYCLYRLEKQGWNTPDAVRAVSRLWKIPFARFSFGGLKDRHALTTQFLSIVNGPEKALRHKGIQLTFLGRMDYPFEAKDIDANRFAIVIRDIASREIESQEFAIRELQTVGVANYFDDQRFGSVTSDGRFAAKEMILDHFEAALRLALAEPYEFDNADAKREKSILNQHWGKWEKCLRLLARGDARNVAANLAKSPEDFRAAILRLRPEMLSLYLAAYQSYLWNCVLANWLERMVPKECLSHLQLKRWSLPTPNIVPNEWQSLSIPLPSARLRPSGTEPWAASLREILEVEGFSLSEMKIREMRKPFFAKGDRPVRLLPAKLTFAYAADERHADQQKLTLEFELPRGSFATMLIKRIAGTQANRPAPPV